jgi:hypothetical protein
MSTDKNSPHDYGNDERAKDVLSRIKKGNLDKHSDTDSTAPTAAALQAAYRKGYTAGYNKRMDRNPDYTVCPVCKEKQELVSDLLKNSPGTKNGQEEAQ